MSRWRGWLSLACCLAVVAAIAIGTDGHEEEIPVSYADVGIGQTGVSTTFAAQVRRVQVTQQVQRDEYSEPLTTDHRFLVVELTADARSEPVSFSGDVWLLTTTGHRYGPRPEFSTAQPSFVDPGFTAAGTFVFQVPTDRLAGARLLVEPWTPLFLTYDVTVRVDLGLTEDSPVITEPVLLAPPSQEVTP
ncbi:hypothetical protein [Pseudactinotalea terrae]|uniref:hypothetical protein n=1 Tax=Pseudactinotalea terrae TaxID=1743262 RepID=UPI0012E11AE5|nr:hypothetical protein [Pseudactinotalea terrae]